MYCIQEADKPNIIFRIFNKIQLREDKIILPITEEKITSQKAIKLAKKTKKILDQTMSKKIVLSQNIQKQEGKWLFELLSCKILDYVIEKKEMKKQETGISILVNDLTENMLSNIRTMAKEYKRVNIVTNHIGKFRKIEKQILEQDGIMITVGNNKRKGISQSKLILNVDFPTELINQYHIFEKAIMINIRGNVKITKKRFDGISINDYDITFEQREEFDYDKNMKYKPCEIYEAQMNKRQPFQEIMKQVEQDKVKITKLVGMNTIL